MAGMKLDGITFGTAMLRLNAAAMIGGGVWVFCQGLTLGSPMTVAMALALVLFGGWNLIYPPRLRAK